ncbi:hypothetical protein V8E51_000995 [Hyaloscypha variabilis]|uniref:Secreted protein n=1 Tax=Hyaloscypha variabilis (strain UAMH 11265 / GT02V1 / F) TaxID=1149755 RepID=A0A2J6RMF2_HYAVF|nr:hypothetical protein L207DRAFT_512664 [Hyaloscypha variabilis F]
MVLLVVAFHWQAGADGATLAFAAGQICFRSGFTVVGPPRHRFLGRGTTPPLIFKLPFLLSSSDNDAQLSSKRQLFAHFAGRSMPTSRTLQLHASGPL